MRSAASVVLVGVVLLLGCPSSGSAPQKQDSAGTNAEDAQDAAVPTAGTSGTAGVMGSVGEVDAGTDAAVDAEVLDASVGLGLICLSNQQQACDCGVEGKSGTRKCNENGIGFGPCLCDADGGAPVGTVTTLYVHGRSGSGLQVDWDYWLGERPGINATPVNWEANKRIGDTNLTVRDAFDAYCSGDNWCYVACHSAGCAQVGYALAHYGTTNGTDTWNIYWIAAAGSAEGGSEVADEKLFSVSVPLDEDLKTVAMRNLYNHDTTNGITHYMLAGAGWADAKSWEGYLSAAYVTGRGGNLPGDDDMEVAYHSSCGVNNTTYQVENAWCNAESLICPGNIMELGVHDYLWAFHEVLFLDGTADYSHFVGDSNEGICSLMFGVMNDYAL